MEQEASDEEENDVVFELDEVLLDVITQVVSNSYEESKETSVIVPPLAKQDSYNSSHYEELTNFNVTEWLGATT